MKLKKTTIIITAAATAAAAVVAVVIWIVPAVKPVSSEAKPVSEDVIPASQGTVPVSQEAPGETKTALQVLNIAPDGLQRIDMETWRKGTIYIDDKEKIKGIMRTIDVPVTAAKEKPKEGKDDVTLSFYKDNAFIGRMRISSEGCTIGQDIFLNFKSGFDLKKLLEYYGGRLNRNLPEELPKEYDDLRIAKSKLDQLTDPSSLMGGIKDYVNKLEGYFKNKAYWKTADNNAGILDVSCMHPSPNVLVVSYAPSIKALGGENPKWTLVFYDDGSGDIKDYRALEDENIFITGARILNGSYLLLAGSCRDDSTAVIGYEIKNGGLIKTKIVEEYAGSGFEVASDTHLKYKNLSPVSFISPKDGTLVNGSGFRGFTDDGFNIMMSKAIRFSFDAGKKLFVVKNTQDAGEWSRQEAISLYKDKFSEYLPASKFPAKADYEEIDSKVVTDFNGQPMRISICSISFIPDGFVCAKLGEYEIGGYVINVDSWSTPSASCLYAIINDSDIMTLEDALYSRKYFIDMKELYSKLPQRYKDLKYITLSSSQMSELEQTARNLIENNLEAFGRVFVLGMLPAETPGGLTGIAIDEFSIFPVKSDKYKTLQDLENFVRSTYIRRTADRLLYNTFGTGPMYLEKDGVFCVNLGKEVGLGYDRDWRNCGIKISETTETSATLTVTVKESFPDDEKEHPQDIDFKMIKRDGKWLLADMIY